MDKIESPNVGQIIIHQPDILRGSGIAFTKNPISIYHTHTAISSGDTFQFLTSRNIQALLPQGIQD